MPTIKLLKRKARDNTANKVALQRFYQDKRWKRLRALKFKNNPLCERCLKKVPQVVRQTEEIHHIIPIDPRNPNEDLIFDYDNLVSLCNECHVEEQGKLRNPKPIEIKIPERGANPIEAQINERREVR